MFTSFLTDQTHEDVEVTIFCIFIHVGSVWDLHTCEYLSCKSFCGSSFIHLKIDLSSDIRWTWKMMSFFKGKISYFIPTFPICMGRTPSLFIGTIHSNFLTKLHNLPLLIDSVYFLWYLAQVHSSWLKRIACVIWLIKKKKKVLGIIRVKGSYQSKLGLATGRVWSWAGSLPLGHFLALYLLRH